jgi:hypothetical protein
VSRYEVIDSHRADPGNRVPGAVCGRAGASASGNPLRVMLAAQRVPPGLRRPEVALALAVKAILAPDALPGPLIYEPKGDVCTFCSAGPTMIDAQFAAKYSTKPRVPRR